MKKQTILLYLITFVLLVIVSYFVGLWLGEPKLPLYTALIWILYQVIKFVVGFIHFIKIEKEGIRKKEWDMGVDKDGNFIITGPSGKIEFMIIENSGVFYRGERDLGLSLSLLLSC
jgi:hypothetical protein